MPIDIAGQDFSIGVRPDSSRVYAFTNRLDAVWAGETNGYHSAGFQGLSYRQQAIFEDLLISKDGKFLPRSVAETTVHPTHLVRRYRSLGITEHLYFPDDHHVLVYELISSSVQEVTLLPTFVKHPVQVIDTAGTLELLQPRYKTESGVAVRVFISVDKPGKWTRRPSSSVQGFPGDRVSSAPVQWSGRISDTTRVIISFAGDRQMHQKQVDSWQTGLDRRKKIMQKMVDHPVTNNPFVNKALLWARVNLDAHIVNQGGKGIYTGLPPLDDYRGRDTFVSLPGATLVNGNYDAAREIIRAFSAYQITDPTHVDYGRVPSRITPWHSRFGSADVTPWFVLSVYEYFRYTGDRVFANEMYPVIKRAIEGRLSNSVNDDGMVEHGADETWMDELGPDGPWSPRGNRAVEVQTLWYDQLRVGGLLAEMLGKTEDAQRWKRVQEQLADRFMDLFWNESGTSLYDHINYNNTPDSSIRPNQAFAVNLGDGLISPEMQGAVMRSVVNSTVYTWGAASLAQSDGNFHPYHNLPQFYPEDASYHNGLVWPWLSGPVISGLVKFGEVDSAYVLTQDLMEKILHRGMAGSVSGMTDALPRNLLPGSRSPDESINLAGNYSRAWNIAEFLRTWHQDYFGITPNAMENQLTLFPQLPEGVDTVRTSVSMGKRDIHVGYSASNNSFEFALQNDGKPITIQLKLRKNDTIYSLGSPFRLGKTDKPVIITFHKQSGQYMLETTELKTTAEPSKFPNSYLKPFHFVTPSLPPGFPGIRAAKYPLISEKQATADNPEARTLLDVKDPVGDDLGPEQNYTYPENPIYEDGIFDLTGAQVRYDEKNVYFDLTFDTLTQSPWDWEPGSSLTYAAIGIHTGDSEGTPLFGQNAQYTTPESAGSMQFILYLGSGYRLVNAAGNTIAEYRPQTAKFSMIRHREGRIHLAVSREHLPQPKKWWKYTVIAGAHRDHYQPGPNGFCTIKEIGAEQEAKKTTPNWYDILRVGY
ncbi:MAG: hypothetical protein K9N57_13825 [Candidatus Marinimicrobia bacterium]|nr:hypothetical protein [Candidatus Neomarinimicrobiota bacterium]